uniref:Uncharacterized protein n=1 Tax=Rhizophora mucronata TaxID=61149 RepID=A0A2P2IMW7_RHIMU
MAPALRNLEDVSLQLLENTLVFVHEHIFAEM